MTTYVHRLVAVPAAQVAVARSLVRFFADSQAKGAADGMFTVGYRPKNTTGTVPTDYVSSGVIDSQFASLLGDAAATFAAYQQMGGAAITLAQIVALYAACPLGSRIRSDGWGNEQACIAALNIEPIPAAP